MPQEKRIVILLILEKGWQGVRHGGAVHRFLQLPEQGFKWHGFIISGAESGADGGKAVPVFREDRVLAIQVQGFRKTLPQPQKEMQRSARKTTLPFSSRPWVRPEMVWSTTAW